MIGIVLAFLAVGVIVDDVIGNSVQKLAILIACYPNGFFVSSSRMIVFSTAW